MKSFNTVPSSIKRDTKIPNTCLPDIIVHWLYEYYYGGNLTITQLRVFLEPRLRDSLHSKEAVYAWTNKADGFMKRMEKHDPGFTSRAYAEYFGVALAA